MFDKILIANRGEIACRIIKTAHELGVACVAVYSDADAQSRHVEMADQAHHIGGSAPADSYLRGDVIVAAALSSGAQAIHPGYGFLSENPDFVDAVGAAGLGFIGPSAAAIRAMGLKDAAKTLMQKSGVPVVPGYHGANQQDDFLAARAEEIGYPVLIKAVAGGGGKGMRLVERAADFPGALASARAEAASSFANDTVLIEKFVEKPRHIEIQIFGDGQNVVHLFERDCSLQRRHQKVIEEAPAPGMTPQMRAAMGDAAVRAAKAIGYSGAGTVEFIVDASDGLRPDRFWFMEMNTRLQVEHPVTEAVTGIDLVEWQLRVAAGEGLPLRQDQLHMSGHAFEARLYAEDPENGFLPTPGRLRHLQFPHGVRADSGVRAGDMISPYYDPMIAKLIVHGPTRKIALSRLKSAISAVQITGTVTNLTFLGNLAAQPDFRAGDVDTGLIARHIGALSASPAPEAGIRALAIVAAAGLDGPPDCSRGFALWAPLQWRISLCSTSGDFAGILHLTAPDTAFVVLGAATVELRYQAGQWQVLTASCKTRVFRDEAHISVFADNTWHFEIPDPLDVAPLTGAQDNAVVAPMPGLIRAIFVRAGQSVHAGERLIIQEAMKMEHVLTAPRDGVIKAMMAKKGDQVEAGALLITLREETK